jgi:hypothetical protein
MSIPYVYYIPIYPDDDHSETLMHLFIGEPGLDKQILDLLQELDKRESKGEGVDYVAELERRLNLRHLPVHELQRHRSTQV